MEFLHCRDCGEAVRLLTFELPRDGEASLETVAARAAFGATHAACRIARWHPTGLAWSSLALHEPLAERRLEVACPEGRGLAIGRREDPDGPLDWRIEPQEVAERLDVGLDRTSFDRIVRRSPLPEPVAANECAALAEAIDRWVRELPREAVVVLEEDARRPNVAFACLTPTSRASLEAWLRAAGIAPGFATRLLESFADPDFPPLAATRSLVPRATGQSPA